MKWVAFFLIGLAFNLIYSLVLSINIEERLSGCIVDKNAEISCLRRIIPTAVEIIGARDLLVLLESKERELDFTCHTAGHLVGDAILINQNELNEALLTCNNQCQYGCTHGVMAKIFRTSQSTNVVEIGRLCESNSHEIEILDTTACFHGVGHGIAEYTGYSLSNSLEMCAMLESEVRRNECATGVFMEIFDMNMDSRILPEISTELCHDAPDSLIVMCETTIMNREFTRTGDDTKSVEACAAMPSEYRNSCFSALGGETVFVYDRDINKIWSTCGISQNGLLPEECVKGAMYSAMVVDRHGDFAISLCSASEKPITQNKCFELLNQKLTQIKSPYLPDICDRLKNEYGYDCSL